MSVLGRPDGVVMHRAGGVAVLVAVTVGGVAGVVADGGPRRGLGAVPAGVAGGRGAAGVFLGDWRGGGGSVGTGF